MSGLPTSGDEKRPERCGRTVDPPAGVVSPSGRNGVAVLVGQRVGVNGNGDQGNGGAGRHGARLDVLARRPAARRASDVVIGHTPDLPSHLSTHARRLKRLDESHPRGTRRRPPPLPARRATGSPPHLTRRAHLNGRRLPHTDPAKALLRNLRVRITDPRGTVKCRALARPRGQQACEPLDFGRRPMAAVSADRSLVPLGHKFGNVFTRHRQGTVSRAS